MKVSLVVALLIGFWCTLAPRAIGGTATYVVVSGHSMLPRYHTDDLVIAREQSSYHLGETVVVEVDGGHVIHALWSGNAQTGWYTKGINKNTPDIWVVPNSHVLGAAWLSLPGWGKYLRSSGTPFARGVLAAIMAVAVLMWPSKRARGRRQSWAGVSRATSAAVNTLLLTTALGTFLAGTTFIAALHVGLGGLTSTPGFGVVTRVRYLGAAAVALLAPSLPLLVAALVSARRQIKGDHPTGSPIDDTSTRLIDLTGPGEPVDQAAADGSSGATPARRRSEPVGS